MAYYRNSLTLLFNLYVANRDKELRPTQYVAQLANL
jgi:hypothetical protein